MPRALVVDDSRAVRMIIARTLRELGYEASEAGDGAQALAVLEGSPERFDLAMVDWNMPGMNGLELVKRLREDQRYADLAIVMVTTETELEHMAAALEAGANEYVMKPFTRDILLERLQLTVERSQEG